MPIKKIALANLLIILSLLACQNTIVGSGATPVPTEDVYQNMRNVWFTTTPEYLEITYEPGSKVPYAILMDVGSTGYTTTVASSIVGDGSLFFSNGGGYLGGVEHENIRQASKRFVELSGEYVDRMVLTTAFPAPATGNVKFYVITPSGIFMTQEVNQTDLAFGGHELSELYFAGDEIISEIQIANGN